jgi:hypothetical protein
MKLKQAQQIIQHHLEWIKSDKTGGYKYTESAFNEALEVVLYNSRKNIKTKQRYE